jgi:predicted DCC family thiol-disulfide oxidoreductase YuxK
MESAGSGTHLVLYDGVCGLCDRLVQFLLAHDVRGVFVFASLQSTLGKELVERFGGDAGELTTFYLLANYRDPDARMYRKSGAALVVARELGWPWKAAVSLRILPAWIRDRVYDGIARRRYRVFGRFDQCAIPRPEVRHRFIGD